MPSTKSSNKPKPSKSAQMRDVRFEAIGTIWRVQLQATISDVAWKRLQQTIFDRIGLFDWTYSRFRRDSWVSKLATQAGEYLLPADAWPLFCFYEDLYEITDGMVTALIGQTLVDAGYDAQYSLQPKTLSAPPKWDDVLRLTPKKLILHQPALLDFGAAGKGYLVDIISKLLEAEGYNDYVIDASGDILQRSTDAKGITVGLENPLDTSEVIGTVELANKSLCASAGNKRQWQGYNHIINPTTLKSPKNVLATWVIAADTMTADGLATALFMVSPSELAKRYTFSYAVLHNDMNLEHDADFPVKLFEVG